MYFKHFKPDTNPDTLRFHYETNVFSTIPIFEALLASLHHHHLCLRSFHTGLLSIVHAPNTSTLSLSKFCYISFHTGLPGYIPVSICHDQLAEMEAANSEMSAAQKMQISR